MLQTRLCLPSLSKTVFELDKIPGWLIAGLDGTSGMVPCTALQTPVQRTRQHGQQTATARSVDRQGPAACLPIHRGGLPGSSCRRSLCLGTGARSSRTFRTGWGLSAAVEGREELHTQSRAGNTKQGLVISRQSSIRPFPALASCSGSCLGPGSRISCYKTLISLRCAQNSARAGQRKESQLSHDRQAGAEEYMGGW